MRRLSRAKLGGALAVALALTLLLPPQINGKRFTKRLASALGAAMGRQVKIGSVQFRVLPRPGFDLYDLEIEDDPAYSAEPLLLCGEATADLRLMPLWKGRLEIANLRLQNAADRMPPSLNLVYAQGHWNVESLLVRAGRVPSAPTAKKMAEQRSRFPYIEADSGRINIKLGSEKKPYTLTNTDFSLWLASEDQWHLRLEGRPVRTDMNLSDTGTIRLEGDLRRAQNLGQMPANLQLTWSQAQLGEVSSLVLGQDKGWRGGLNLSVQLEGTLSNLRVAAHADLRNPRRYDITRPDAPRLNANCLGDYSPGLVNFNCGMPLEGGAVRLRGSFSPGSPGGYDLALVANRVPLAALASLLRHAKRTLPDDLTATGQMDAAFAFHSHWGATNTDDATQADAVRDWHGEGMTSPFLLQSAAIQPAQVSAIHFHLGQLESHLDDQNSPVRGGRRPVRTKPTPSPAPTMSSTMSSMAVEPFFIDLGSNNDLGSTNDLGSANLAKAQALTASQVQAQALFRASDYRLEIKGGASIERLLDLGKIGGFPWRAANPTGTATFDLTVSGAWAGFAPARLEGVVRAQNVNAAIPGVKERLLLSSVEAQFTDSAVVFNHLAGQFEHSPVAFSGSLSRPLNCAAPAAPCMLQFDLHADTLATSDVALLLGLKTSAWSLPFLSDANRLPDFRAGGTLTLGALKIGPLALEKFTAHLETGGHVLVIRHAGGKLAGGSAEGDWRVDWSASPARYSGTGTLNGVMAERVPLPAPAAALLSSWLNGKTNLRYKVDFSGESAAAMLESAAGSAEFQVANGVSHALALDAPRPTRFQNLQGSFELLRATLKLLPSKFRARDRIYEVSGAISLADKEAKLKVSGGASRWEITGALDKPAIAPRPGEQEASVNLRKQRAE